MMAWYLGVRGERKTSFLREATKFTVEQTSTQSEVAPMTELSQGSFDSGGFGIGVGDDVGEAGTGPGGTVGNRGLFAE